MVPPVWQAAEGAHRPRDGSVCPRRLASGPSWATCGVSRRPVRGCATPSAPAGAPV